MIFADEYERRMYEKEVADAGGEFDLAPESDASAKDSEPSDNEDAAAAAMITRLPRCCKSELPRDARLFNGLGTQPEPLSFCVSLRAEFAFLTAREKDRRCIKFLKEGNSATRCSNAASVSM